MNTLDRPQREATLVDLEISLANLRDRLNFALAAADDAHDRLVGPRPVPVVEPNSKHAGGLVSSLMTLTRDMSATAERLIELNRKIARVVGGDPGPKPLPEEERGPIMGYR